MAARSIGSGTITFGLVSIPVKLYTATSSKQVSFNMLHKECHSRVKQQLVCPAHTPPPVVERSDTVRGFEHSRDTFVVFTDEELKALEAEKSSILELVEFVPASTVDFVYIERTYYLGPDKGGDRAYRLLSNALESEQRIAVGRFAQRGKDELVLVRPYKNGLMLHVAYYSDEVKAFEDIELGAAADPKPAELELAKVLIQRLDAERFDATKFKDEYAARVNSAVEQKLAGQAVVIAPEAPKAQIVDLLAALQQSVAGLAAKVDVARANDVEAPRVKGPKKAAPRKAETAKKKRRADA